MADPPQYRDAGPGSHPFPWLPGPTPTRPAGDRSGATAEGLHHFAAETYPFLGELDAQKSVPVLSAGSAPAKDIWLLGIGVSLIAEGVKEQR